MTKPKSIGVASVLTIAALPILFLFQNCSSSTQFKMEEASAVQTSSAPDVCQPMNEIVGDMRVTIIPGSPWAIEFGTFADNYWDGNQTGKIYDRKLELFIPNKTELTQFKLEHTEFDDWMSLKVNGQLVYVGPHGGDRLERENGRVRFGPSASDISDAELGRSWSFNLATDLLPFLVDGQNTIEMRTIVAGAGEGALRISVQGGDCRP